MSTFVMLIKMSPELGNNPASLREFQKRIDEKRREACPEVTIATNLALLGPYDFLNLVEAPSHEAAFRFASVLLKLGFAASVETWTALHFTYPKMKELMIGI